MRVLLVAVLALSLFSACQRQAPSAAVAPAPAAVAALTVPDTAKAAIAASTLMASIETLSSDAFEGRLPGTAGEEKTVAFLTEQFKALGLAPGNPDGSYVQKVPLAGIDGRPSGQLRVKDQVIPLDFNGNAVAVTERYQPEVTVSEAPLVFVGYGVQAPELGWDDYKGLDVRGKTLVMLVNDPPVRKADGSLDEAMFGGKAMTYYGRWTYKYDIASQLGAAAAIIVHQTGPAGYPWFVVANSWRGEQFTVASADGNAGRVAVQSWIALDKARELFAAAGLDFAALEAAAARPDFRPVEIAGSASFTVKNTLRTVDSHNVAARLPGTDPALGKELIVYSAHWDHLGRDDQRQGDPIFNGALDNATGTAGLIEVARAFSRLPEPPRRSLLFLAVTAEEQGLIGSRYYAQNPLYPIGDHIANINMDALNPYGPTEDVIVVGKGQSTLEDVLAGVVQAQGRRLVADPDSDKGYYYRSDHFNFAKAGVPALYADGGSVLRDRPAGTGQRLREAYTREAYHQPADQITADWNPAGMVEDLQMLFEVGYRVAQTPERPQWKDGSEFKRTP